MHPLSTVLFIAGYGLALPLGTRLPTIVAKQQRLAFAGHQVGIVIAIVGWLVRGSFIMAMIHVLWAVGSRIWYSMTERKLAEAAASVGPVRR